MARQDKFKIQRGDVLYEPSYMYSRVIEHEILDIFLEGYVGGYKTIITTKSRLGRSEKFSSDVVYWFDTEEEALEKLKEEREKHVDKTIEETWYLE